MSKPAKYSAVVLRFNSASEFPHLQQVHIFQSPLFTTGNSKEESIAYSKAVRLAEKAGFTADTFISSKVQEMPWADTEGEK